MAARTIETKAIISAEDKTGNAFSAVVQKMAKMESAARTARINLGSVDRAAQTMRRTEGAHAREMAKVQREQLQVQREIKHHGAGRYVAQTAATAVAAHSIVDMVRDTVKAGASYQHEVVALKNAGRNAKEMEEITRAARDAVQQIPTSTYTENLRVINETTSAFGSLGHAIENLPLMQKSAAVLQSAMPAGTHVDPAELGNQMARAFEERGTAGDPEVFRKEASEVMRAMVFSGGKFNPHEFLNFAQQAKSSLQGYNLDFLSNVAPTIIGTQGGQRAGTSAKAFTDVVMGKANDAKQAAEWMKYDLLDRKDVIMKKGQAVAWRAGAVRDTKLAMANPLEWAETVALPRMQAKGVDVNDKDALSQVLATMFRTGTGNFFAAEIMQAAQRSRLHKDKDLKAKTGTVDDMYARNLAEDPTASMQAFSAALENFTTVLSKAAMPTIASGLTSLASGIEVVSNALHDHPLLALAGGTAAAGGALAGSGYMAYSLANGFGLSASATALEGSAVALDAAAVRLGAGGAIGTAEQAADHFLAGGSTIKTGAKAAGLLGLGTVGTAGLLGGALLAFDGAMIYGAPKLFGTAKGTRYGGKQGQPVDDPDHPGMHFVAAPRRGSSGYWAPNVPAPAPMPSLAPIASTRSSLPMLAGPGGGAPVRDKVSVDFSQPPPIRVIVEAGSSLLSVVNDARASAVQLRAQVRADTGPGGLGETSTAQ